MQHKGNKSNENNKNNKNSESRLLQIIEYKGKLIMFLIGVILLAVPVVYGFFYKQDNINGWKPLVDVVGQIGGIFVSAAGVAYFYDKYRDQKQAKLIEEGIKEHQKLLVDEREETVKKWTKQNKETTESFIKFSSRGIQEKVYIECVDKEFINIIPREELDKNGDYRFEAMTMKMVRQSDEEKEKYPVLIYGSTLGIFDWIDEKKKEGNEANKKALIEAVRQGVHFKLALNAPEAINTNNVSEDKKKRATITNVVNGLKGIIAEELPDAIGSIDLRYLPKVEKNSFSSFVCDGRRVSVLDFNFESNPKLSQIFDEKLTVQNDSQNLAFLLTKSYEMAHKKGIPCICYNVHEMKIYVIGIRHKQMLMQKNGSTLTLPLITEKGYIKENANRHDNCPPENIYEKIKNIYMEITNCDIQLCEFLSPDNPNEDICFVIGRISSDVNGINVQWENVYNKEGHFISDLFPKMTPIYHGRLQNLLRCYGIENN